MKQSAHCRRHVEAWRKSELSQADYCRQQDINPKTFSRWIRLELARDRDAPFEIIPIQIVPAEPAPAAEANITLRLAHGAQLELSTAVSPRWLAELLQCLA
jgi:transposase-like protein